MFHDVVLCLNCCAYHPSQLAETTEALRIRDAEVAEVKASLTEVHGLYKTLLIAYTQLRDGTAARDTLGSYTSPSSAKMRVEQWAVK